MNEDYYHEQNSCYDPNSFGFDQFQPSQYTVNHPIFNAQNSLLNSQNEFLNSQNKLMEQMTSMCDMVGQFIQKKEEEKRIEEEQAAKDRYWKIPVCYDDDDDEESSIPLKDIIILSGLFLQSLLHRDTSINDSQKIDSLLDEFTGELTLPHSIPLGIDDVNLDPEGDILVFSPSPIPVEEVTTLMERLKFFLMVMTQNHPVIESDDFRLRNDDNSNCHPEFESFHVLIIPNSGDSTIEVLGGMTSPLMCQIFFAQTIPSPSFNFEFIPFLMISGSDLNLLSPSEIVTRYTSGEMH
ncbi:hypothetical protein Tco_0236334 [Tanacetum coccineum]